MTREEAIKGLTSLVEVRRKYFDMQTMKDEIECLDIAIEALEQESKLLQALEMEKGAYNALVKNIQCADAISRQAVLDVVFESRRNFNNEFDQGFFVDKIRDLSPVQPQPKTGRWVDDKCSACGRGIEDLIESSEWYRNEQPNFCPFCGIKMVEPQESEVQDAK